jgi:hypothetical protein
MCRSPIGHLIPSRENTSTYVTLNVSAVEQQEDAISRRVRVATILAEAMETLGAAPRNSRYTMVPFHQRGTLPYRVQGIIDPPIPDIVPPSDEDDGASISSS